MGRVVTPAGPEPEDALPPVPGYDAPEDVLLLCLATQPGDRPTTISELAARMNVDVPRCLRLVWVAYGADLVTISHTHPLYGGVSDPRALWLDLTRRGIARAVWIQAWVHATK